MKNKSRTLGYAEGWASIAINLVLFALKYWAGLTTGSVAIIADAWHTLSDSLTSIVVIVGFKMSSKPADRDHPFGHGRAELIAAVIIGVLLAVVGFNFLLEAIEKLRHHESASFGIFAVIVFVVSTILKEGLAQFAFWAGKKTGSRALKADGWHHRSDAIASVIILAGMFLGKYFWWIDGVLGIAVALLILYATCAILKEAVSPLVGETPDSELKAQVEDIACRAARRDIRMHHIHLHRYGSHVELTMRMLLPGAMSIDEAGEISRRIEETIRSKFGFEATLCVESREGDMAEDPSTALQ